MADYELWWLDANADYAHAQIGDYVRLTYGRRVGEVGTFDLVLPGDAGVPLARDMRLVIYRRPAGGFKGIDFVGLVRYWEPFVEGNVERILVEGFDYNHYLARRVVAYAAASAGASKSGAADNVMKAFVRENLGALAPAGRNISALGFSVQADLAPGAGPTVYKDASYDPLLETLQKVAASAYQAGTPTYFGVVPLLDGWSCEFRTRTGQWGQDHRDVVGADGAVIFAVERGNMGDPSLAFDAREEVTFVYGGGPSEKGDRVFVTAEDAARSAASALNRIEGFYDASALDTPGALASGAAGRLNDGRPRRRFSFAPLDAEGCRYGVHWGLGDYVTGCFTGEQWDVRIAAVEVTLDGGEETIDAAVEEVSA